MAVSTLLVLFGICLLPGSFRTRNIASRPALLDVHLAEVPTAADPAPVPPTTQAPAEETPVEDLPEQAAAAVPAAPDPDDLPAPQPQVDWYAAMQAAARNVGQQDNKTASMTPRFDRLRQHARRQFRASMAPVKKPAWENVEKDQLGRTILRAGDCYRVLDDPSVANQWVQENFTQYIVFCSNADPPPQELPFVADIIARYAYLRPEDSAGPAAAPR